MGAPKAKDHRTDGWRSNWLKKKKEKKSSVTDAAQKAAALIMGLRRAAKKGKSFEVRKIHRKLATEREKEGGGDVAKMEKWTATMEAIKRIDLDVACAAACAVRPLPRLDAARILVNRPLAERSDLAGHARDGRRHAPETLPKESATSRAT